ncbi:potassium channel family protein [Collimonas pratensis]|uniref:NAD binding domain of 6-phosphogluconate dehydrogenase family protein n=1 Tax=Collimonas pratensis TaxID=279113 RepID=A0A127Q5N9_9BURK|nr:TrkA family potassium uptake protein [Collimonas pratensis]AMP05125.1 NAD binding domain of 6-phosphogluconate dehydrogenase family protein [Collimonas pratensis]
MENTFGAKRQSTTFKLPINRHKYAVIGLGSFGSTVAVELEQLGNEVLGIDTNESLVSHLADQLSHVAVADAKDERVLRDLGLPDYDGVVIAMGRDLEASILCTLAMKNVGVGKVWVKASTPAHHLILEKLGADRIVNPEYHVGVHVARTMIYPHVLDYIALGDNDYIVEFDVPKELNNKRLNELSLRERYRIEVLAFKRGDKVSTAVSAEFLVSQGDRLILLGSITALRAFSRDQL